MTAAQSASASGAATPAAAPPAPSWPRILPCGDTALTVEFGDTVDRRLSALAIALAERLDGAAIPGVLARVPTFRSLLVHFDPLQLDGDDLAARLVALTGDLGASQAPARLWRLPACYHPSQAPDLEEVAGRVGLTVPKFIEAHSAVTYHVYMLGFLPGYPYMGDMPPALALPRRESPRIKVAAGSISIAMNLTSIYTFDCPGGWHLIARTPVQLWDMRRATPALMRPGDKVALQPISPQTFEQMAEDARVGRLELVPQPVDNPGARA